MTALQSPVLEFPAMLHGATATICREVSTQGKHAVSPPPPWSAERTARRLAALLRFWNVLQGPRYAYRVPDTHHSLEELMDDLYRPTLEAWCPEGATSIREQLTRAMERMARATREECIQAVLRVIPVLVQRDTGFKHAEVLTHPDLLRERLAALSPEDFAEVSGTCKYPVYTWLAAWDRQLVAQDS